MVANPRCAQFKKGDKVVFLTGNLIPKKGSVGGTYAEYCLVQESCAAVLTPEAERHLPLRDAGGLPVAALTALSVLDKLALKPAAGGAPQRVLLFGASGGVGQIAVQLAKARGLHVVGVCSAKHAAHVASLGADETFDYALGKDALAERFGATNDTKFDGILDLVGGDLPRFAARALVRGAQRGRRALRAVDLGIALRRASRLPWRWVTPAPPRSARRS